MSMAFGALRRLDGRGGGTYYGVIPSPEHPMMEPLTNPHLTIWDALLQSSASAARSATRVLSAAQLAQRPSWGGWSVGEVFEHLCITDGLYVAPLQALFAAEHATSAPRRSPAWTPTLFGRLLLWSINPSNARKSPAPAAFRPGAVRDHVVESWLAQVERTRALMREADGLDLRRLKLSSPAAKLIRLNAGDAFALCAVHAQRHLGQVARTIADVTGAPVAE